MDASKWAADVSVPMIRKAKPVLHFGLPSFIAATTIANESRKQSACGMLRLPRRACFSSFAVRCRPSMTTERMSMNASATFDFDNLTVAVPSQLRLWCHMLAISLSLLVHDSGGETAGLSLNMVIH